MLNVCLKHNLQLVLSHEFTCLRAYVLLMLENEKAYVAIASIPRSMYFWCYRALVLKSITLLVYIVTITHRGNTPVAMSSIPVYDTVPDPAVSDKVKMESNPVYQVLISDYDHTNKGPDPAYEVLASDLANKGADPAYQDMSSYSGRASVSKQKLTSWRC